MFILKKGHQPGVCIRASQGTFSSLHKQKAVFLMTWLILCVFDV